MKIYSLTTEFTFGKHIGKTIEEVLEIEPDYIDWCILNLDHFLLEADFFEELFAKNIHFELSEKASIKLEEKYSDYEQAHSYHDDYEDYDEKYTIDDAFRDAFEGDIDAWNAHYQD